MKHILYLLPSYNLYGGTPKKTLDLMKYFGETSSLYVWSSSYSEFKQNFIETGGKIFEGSYGRNLIKHIITLLRIIDTQHISIIQTQFSMGAVLGYLLKILRPKLKFIVAFVGPPSQTGLKRIMVNHIYKRADSFIFISEYIKREMISKFPVIENCKGTIIYNGTENRVDFTTQLLELKKFSILDVAGLIHLKNIQVIIYALDILINKSKLYDVFFYVAGDGPERETLESLVEERGLQNHIYFLGYQRDVGSLLASCDLFVHPAYAEGFGIAVAEAMLADKPIIISNAGALPELIIHQESGLVVDPHDPQQWADAILLLKNDRQLAKRLAQNAKERAEKNFTAKSYVESTNAFYEKVL